MLTSNVGSKNLSHISLILLFFISFSIYQPLAFADNKQKIAEDYREKGFLAQQKGDIQEALTYYSKAISLGLENPKVLNDMGVLYEEIDFPAKAEKFYLKAIQIDEGYLPAYMNLAYLYKNNDDLDKAYLYFKKRYDLGMPSDPWRQKAEEELIKINPRFGQEITRKKIEELNEEVQSQVEAAFYQRINRAKEHFQEGERLADSGDYQKALSAYDQALTLVPNYPEVVSAKKKVIWQMKKQDIKNHTDQAMNLLNVGDPIAARREIQEILSKIPNESNY